MNTSVTLVCTPLRFYTKNDEAAFFSWIKTIKCIENIKGVGRELYLYINPTTISHNDLLDLMGVFDRYKFDAQQLQVFMNEDNRTWFDE